MSSEAKGNRCQRIDNKLSFIFLLDLKEVDYLCGAAN